MTDGLIAIIGAACRFPGAPDLDAFWELLSSGTDAVSEVDLQRWSTRYYYHPKRGQRGRSYSWSAGLIDGIDLFEPAFFGISPREAAQMDPQQRLMLELAWHAVEDAGIPASRLAGSATGVYVGASSTDYRDRGFGDPAAGDVYTMTGATLSIVANRLSYVFDLRGPSLVVDTACSSSLVALHHACEALRADRIGSAIVGGVNLLLSPFPFIGFCNASMLSRQGHCFAFDARADGYVRAEGGAAIVLKPLGAALADGDPIRAVIVGTGVNSDGRTIGLSLPSEAAQANLLRSVYAAAGVAPDELAFFEMHGTGTPAGDPIEAAAVGAALGRKRERPLPIGSVKTNIGHLEPASGMAGLLKAALALERGVVPPSLHCETPNPNIRFGEFNLRVVHEVEPITAEGSYYAGVNSFGFGGTNGHAVLAPPPLRAERTRSAEGPLPPLLISARSEMSLRLLARDWHDRLARTRPEHTPALVRAAARRRDQHPHRMVVLGGSGPAVATALEEFLDRGTDASVVSGTALRDSKLAFVFSGNGAQWPGMGRNPLFADRDFREAVIEVDALLHPAIGWSAAAAIEQGVDADQLARADIAQPLLFAIQYATVAVLRRLGVEAAACIGHSVGEIAAAWASGALSLAEAVRVVVARSRNQERTRGDGRMAALGLGAKDAGELIAEMGAPLEVGAINARQSVTVSGPAESIEHLAEEARRRGIVCRPLDLDFAFHSAAMDPIRESLLADLAGLGSIEPERYLVSTVTGAAIAAGDLDAEYWWRNIRSPVRFSEALGALIADGCRILLEIGPHPVLQSYLHDGLRAAEAQGRVLPSLSRKHGAENPFPALAAACHVAGYDITGAKAFDGPNDPQALPLYRWTRERFWFERTTEDPDLIAPGFEHPLLGFRRDGPAPYWRNVLDPELLPWIADHAIEGLPVLPGAAVVEMALATALARRPDARVLEVCDLELRRPLPFDKGWSRELRCVVATEEGDWELSSRARLSEEPLTLHAVGRITASNEAALARPQPFRTWPKRSVGSDTLYGLAARFGLDYGPLFQTVKRVEVFGSDRALVHLEPAELDASEGSYLIHPALLDGALQGLLALLAADEGQLDGSSFLPWRFGRVRLAAPFGRVPTCARVQVTRIGSRSASADIVLTDEHDAVVAALTDCWMRRVELSRRGGGEDRVLRIDLVPAPLDRPEPPPVLDRMAETILRLSQIEDGRRTEQALLLEALAAATAYRAVASIVAGDTPFAIEDLIAQGRVAAGSVPLVLTLLTLLDRFAAAEESAGEWRLKADHDLPAVADVWRLLLAEAPDLVAELALLAATAEELPRLIAEGPRPGTASITSAVEHLLQASPASEEGIDLVCRILGDIGSVWPQGRPLRILEVGAGGGTRRFLDRLAASAAALSYVATSPDAEQAGRLGFTVDRFIAASARQWCPGENDHLAPRSFDLVLAVNGSAQLRFDQPLLSRIRELLAPGGLLVAVEPAPNPLWDLVFGAGDEWWLDGANARPLHNEADWRRELALAGFERPVTARVATGPWPSLAVCGKAPADVETQPVAVVPVTVQLIGGRAAQLLGPALAASGHNPQLVDADAFPVDTGCDGKQAAVLLIEEDGDAIARAGQLIPNLVRFAAVAAERGLPLFVVTSGAEHAETGLLGATVSGFARVLFNEMPRLSLRLIDVSAAFDWSEHARILAAELTAESPETEIVWTQAGRHVPRLRRGLSPRHAAPSAAVSLTSDRPGGLDSLTWKRREPRLPQPDEVEVEVRAAGLNFRDMMWAMGLLPEEALIDGFAGATYGLECAGVVRAVGPGVEEFRIGDRVAGFAPASLSSRVTTLAHALMPIPDDTSFAAAATIPVAFVTAVYALGTLGKLGEGEYVLIHAAAGGVGLAAIQYAKYRGAVVIATAGSEIKRNFLRLAGADHVLDSRDIGFADAVRVLTAGAGVDVVLNSLSGDAMELSLSVLKPFGRFLELGKRDFYLNRRIHLRPLRQNISYFGIDVDQLPVQRPDIARGLLSEIAAALCEGGIRPLAHRRFRFGEIDEAFRLMQASGHIGKIVLEPSDNAGVQLRDPPEMRVSADGIYLVTGGLSGFGFEAARWLAQNGARRIALLGRRGLETPGAFERERELAAGGVEVSIHAADVADRSALTEVLQDIRQAGPLRGVVHAASAIADGLAVDVDTATVEAMLGPKLGGAILLDELTRDDPLDLFLLFSSATTVLGAPGQSVYVAANHALEALARRRRAEGLPAIAVAWGPIGDAGYLAARPEMREALGRRLGAKPIPAAEALAALPVVAGSGLATAAVAETSWQEARRFLPILAQPLFSELRGEAAAAPSDDTLLEKLAAASAEEAVALLKTVVAEEAANILRLPAAGIDPMRPLSEMGMDSLMAVELRLALESRLRIDLPLVSLAEGTSVASIAGRLAASRSAQPQTGEIVGLVERYEGLDHSHIMAALREEADMFDPDDIKSEAAE